MWTLLLFQLLSGSIISANITVLNDIKKAFHALTNDSQLLEHIIPEMYGKTMQMDNPAFIFKMPTQGGSVHGFEMLKMQRSDFAEPIFPNITQFTQLIAEAIETPSSTPQSHLKSSLSATSSSTASPAQWQQFGLGGWTGQLLQPVAWVEQTHKDEPLHDWVTSYPHAEILLELKNYHFDGRVTDIRIVTDNTADNKEAELQDLMNEQNVYIARVNDPFGYSMKWPRQNETVDLETRGKRDVARLYSMIKCSTGCEPLIYKGYGCYCGFGGHGVPADGIDRCCRLHDKCYGQSNCISYLEYFVPYIWKCYRGKPLCAIDHGQWGGPDSCAARLCQCDLRLSRCLRQFYCPRRRAVCHSSRARRLQNLIFFD